MHSPTFQLTQHFLAQLLAVRRASVSKTARTLADNGCISYVRGVITILDRPRLQSSACSCYQALHDSTTRTLTVTIPAPGHTAAEPPTPPQLNGRAVHR
jgi:hypothetical protein